MSNPHAIAARERKARAIATVMEENGISASMLTLASAADWRMAAQATRDRMPSMVHMGEPSAETRALVLQIMTEREQIRARRKQA